MSNVKAAVSNVVTVYSPEMAKRRREIAIKAMQALIIANKLPIDDEDTDVDIMDVIGVALTSYKYAETMLYVEEGEITYKNLKGNKNERK